VGNAKEADHGPAKTVPDCGPSEEQPRGPGQGTGWLRRQPPRARGLGVWRLANPEPPPRPIQRRAFPVHRDSDLWSQRRPWQSRCDQQVPRGIFPPRRLPEGYPAVGTEGHSEVTVSRLGVRVAGRSSSCGPPRPPRGARGAPRWVAPPSTPGDWVGLGHGPAPATAHRPLSGFEAVKRNWGSGVCAAVGLALETRNAPLVWG
jgi:hypothetical protein